MEDVIKVKPAVRLSKGDKVFNSVCYIFVIVLCVSIIIPVLYVLACSFSSGFMVSTGQVTLWPKEFSLEGYRRVFNYKGIWRAYLNTIFYTASHTLLHLIIVILAAYPLAKKGLPHKKGFVLFFTITMLFSGGIIPTYLLIRNLKLLNTPFAIIIPGAFTFYNMSVCRTFIANSIPEDLWEAADIDGCGPLRFLLQVVIPLSKGVIAVIAMQVAIGVWNSYMNAMLYLSKPDLYPLQIELRNILIMSQVPIESLDADVASAIQGLAEQMKFALIVVSTVPIMCVYPFVQKYFVKGVMIGSVKG